MRGRTDSIQRLLQTLAKHSDLVSEAFAGPVAGGERQRENAITALLNVGALKPYEEGTYYLGAQLHDYFASVLASFHALQALTRIRGHIHQAREQWSELRLLRAAGASKDVLRMTTALERSVIEIGDIVERNIALLNSMVLGQYGNVQDLESKFRQNRFYAREVTTSLRELGQVEQFVQDVTEGNVGEGLSRIRQLVGRRLGTNLLPWSSRLKDAQSVISRRLFEARLMERRLKQLAKYSSWLTANPTQGGWDLEIPEDVNPALCRCESMAIRPQPHFSEPMAANMERLVETARRLPKPLELKAQRKDAREDDNIVISDEVVPFVVPLEPHQLALEQLCNELDERGRHGKHDLVSLSTWKTSANDAVLGFADTPIEHWLIYAALQLAGGDYRLRFVAVEDTEPFSLNTRFHDIEVARTPGDFGAAPPELAEAAQ